MALPHQPPKTRGGKRPGSGRKSTGNMQKGYKLTLLPEEHERIRELGGATWLAEIVRAALTK